MKKNFFFQTKAPLRVSLFGGGTDFENYYNYNDGATISFTINKFIYTTIKNHDDKIFSEKIRLNYSESERVNNIKNIKNRIIKQLTNQTKFKKSFYLSTISDVPEGTGLGSSSAFITSLIVLLNKLNQNKISKHQIAKYSYNLEKKKLNMSVGAQDHFISVYGGFKRISYSKNEIKVQSLDIYKNELNKLLKKIIFIWTGTTRKASSILSKQDKNIKKNYSHLKKIYETQEIFYKLLKNKLLDYRIFGELLKESWISKKELERGISNNKIEEISLILEKNKSIGFKVLGAGGGGFVMAAFSEENKKDFEKKFKNKLNIYNFKFYEDGIRFFNMNK